MKKFLPRIIVVFVAMLTLYFVIFHKKDTKEEVPVDMNFSIEDKEDVHRIYLAGKDGRVAEVKREGDIWMVNDRYEAMPAKIATLLSTLKSMKVFYPVPESARENVIKDLATGSTKVELYSKGAKNPFKVFYVGSSTKDGTGTYMIMQLDGKTADRPYVVYIPGFVGFLSPRFILDEVEWRNTNVFHHKLEDIQKVRMEYLKEPIASFEIEVVNEDSFTIQPLDAALKARNQKGNKQTIITYLSFFENLNVEGFANESVKKDSLDKEEPYALLTVTDKEGVETQMEVHRMDLNKRSKLQFDEHGQQIPYDLDRYYAFINEGEDFVIIQHFVFGKVFRSYSEFLDVD